MHEANIKEKLSEALAVENRQQGLWWQEMEVIPEVWGKESGRGPRSRAFGQMSEKRRYTVQGEKWNPAK